MELGLDSAVEFFQRAVALDPNDPDGWRELGEALAYDGRPSEAGQALHRAVRLRPEDTAALVSLGHASMASGHRERAITYLGRALESDPENIGALQGLVTAYRSVGRPAEALEAAKQVAAAAPADIFAALDVAELSLELGRLDEAVAAFGRLREVDDDPEHEVYAYHGMIEAELKRESLAARARPCRRRDAHRPPRPHHGHPRADRRARVRRGRPRGALARARRGDAGALPRRAPPSARRSVGHLT